MSVELAPGSVPIRQASDEEVITWVRAAIEDAKKAVDDGPPSLDLQQNGVTVDLTHRNIVDLPDEAVEIMRMEIERLAISHNRIVSFPAKLADCHRLRYLNVRYNALKEVPKAILQLESLEILDLSRNRIKVLPEEIGNLTSLKVLAISRNRIERLPIRLCELSRLQLLKFDDNPLVFPPPESYAMDPSQPRPTIPGELEAVLTAKIKRSLARASKRGASSKDLDADFDPAKTPRPAPRKGSGRYPVKTSRDDGDQAITSPPDAPPVPSIPSKHFNPRAGPRSQRGLTASSDAPILWSPNQSSERLAPSDYTNQLTGSTLRSDHRSHAIITPRLPPGSGKLSESSLYMTSPDGSDGSATAILMGHGGSVVTQFQPNLSRSIDSPRILALWTKAINHGVRALLAFVKTLDYIRSNVANFEWSDTQISRINTLLVSLQVLHRNLEDRRSLLPIIQTPRQMNLVGRSISGTLLQIYELTGTSKASSSESVFRTVTDEIFTKMVGSCVSSGENTELVASVAAAQYQTMSARMVMSKARSLLPAEFFQKLDGFQPTVAARRPYAPNMQINTSFSSLSSIGPPPLNTAVSLAVRPVQSATQSPVGLSATSSFADFSGSMSFASSPTTSEPPLGMWNNRLVDPEDLRRNDAQDAQYNKLLGLLNKVIQSCLSPDYSALRFLTDCMQDKYQEVLANAGVPGNSPLAQRMWLETSEALGKCLTMVQRVVEVLPMAPSAKEFNEAQPLQEYIRFMISYWGDFGSVISQIRRNGLWKGMPTMIPKYMQMIHVPMKEFSKYLKATPQWMHLAMDTSVLPGREQANGVAEASAETPSENFPSTPLGAALGPAAAAAMARPNTAFMSRYDQYASNSNRRY